MKKAIRRWLGMGELWERQQKTEELVAAMCSMLRNHDETLNPYFMTCFVKLAVALSPVIGYEAAKNLYHFNGTYEELHNSMLEAQERVKAEEQTAGAQ